MLYWCYDSPHFLSTAGKKHYFALTLIQQLLGGNSATEFAHKLVDVKKQALEVSSQYDGDSLDPKDFSIAAVLSPEMKVAAVNKSIKDYLHNLIHKGVSPALLARAKNDTLAPIATLKDGTEQYLQAVAQHIGKGKTIDDLNSYIDNIEAVTVDDIKTAAAYVFDKDPVVVIEMYPAKGQ
jgi:zinc protease